MPSLVARYDPAYAARVQELDSVFSALMMQSLERPIGERKPVPFRIALQFDSLSEWLTRTHQREQMTDERIASYALAAAAARTNSKVARVSGTFTRKMHEVIDDIIAENLVFVADSLYQSQKIIVWSQNDRIVRNKPPDRQYGESTSGMAAPFERASPQNTPYSIALFGVSGDKVYQRQVRSLPPSPDLGLAQLLYDTMGRTVLLTANATTNSGRTSGATAGATAKARSRDRSRRSASDSRITTLRAMEKYDAVLVISSVSAVTPTPR